MLERFFEANRDRWSESTEELYRHYLEDLIAHLAGDELAAVSVETLRAWLSGHARWGASSRYQAIAAARHLFAWAIGEETSPAHRLRMPRRVIRPQKTLRAEEVERFLAACDTSTGQGTRDAALIALMVDTGLRVGEACSLRLEDLDLAERTLSVKVKGGKWGQAVFGAYTARLLGTWLAMRSSFALPGVQAVFVGVGGTKPGTGMTRHGVRANFYRIGYRAGLGPIMPHALRRTFATLALRAGAPSRLVQVAGRWSSLAMVERYSQALTPRDFDPWSPINRMFGVDDSLSPSQETAET
jgi:integrase/recombinase XerD